MKKLLAGGGGGQKGTQTGDHADSQAPQLPTSSSGMTPTSSNKKNGLKDAGNSSSMSSSGQVTLPLPTFPADSASANVRLSPHTPTSTSKPESGACLSTSVAAHPACLYCAEKIDTTKEDYCQLGGSGARYWHTSCVERSRERREATMMLMHSMNKLASDFFQQLNTTLTDDDERTNSNNTEEGDADTEGNSSATEGDLTIRSAGTMRARKKTITLWDDSDVSDAEATLRGHYNNSLRRESTTATSLPHTTITVTTDERPTAEMDGTRPAVRLWGQDVRRAAGWRPQPTIYRSLSFELDSAGNTIRPKPKRQRGRDKERAAKEKKEKEQSVERQHRNTDAPAPVTPRVTSQTSIGMHLSAVSPLTSPKHYSPLSSSSHSSEDETTPAKEKDSDTKDRPRKKKRSKTEKGNLIRANKCAICSEWIGREDNYVVFSGTKYHLSCFPCSACLRSQFFELSDGKMVCHQCLPQCDGCGLALIPLNARHGKPPAIEPRKTSSPVADVSVASTNDEEPRAVADGEFENEVVIERNGTVQRYHKKCLLNCASCKQPVQRKRGKLYKKQGKPWCARCIAKCSVFEEKAFQFPKSKSRSSSVQGATMTNSPTTVEELLNEETSAHSFLEFLIHDYAVENLLFYLDVEAFKRLKRKQDIVIQANHIYNKYLITEAELEVTSIDSEERKKLTYMLANKTGKVKNNFFDAAQKLVLQHLKAHPHQPH